MGRSARPCFPSSPPPFASDPAQRLLRPGFYAWWAAEGRSLGPPHHPHPARAELGLLYVGINPARASSAGTIRSRVVGQHVGGNTSSSTFRFVLASLLLEHFSRSTVRGPRRRSRSSELERFGRHRHRTVRLQGTGPARRPARTAHSHHQVGLSKRFEPKAARLENRFGPLGPTRVQIPPPPLHSAETGMSNRAWHIRRDGPGSSAQRKRGGARSERAQIPPPPLPPSAVAPGGAPSPA